MNRGFTAAGGVIATCLMAGLIGAVAITGRWPSDAPRTHLEKVGILAVAPEGIASIECSVGDQRTRFNRGGQDGWLVNDAAAGPAVAGHIDVALRLLTASPPRRVLAASEYDPRELAAYGLEPARFVLAVTPRSGRITRLEFGEVTPARNAQYVRIAGRPELYLLPRDVSAEWDLARNMAGRTGRLLPVPIAQVWAIEIVSQGALYRFERDVDGLWFHHVGQHVHTPGGFVHHADPKLAPLIEAELAGLDGLPIARMLAPHPGEAALNRFGLEHPTMILLLYSRDSAGPVARVEFGNAAAQPGHYARIRESDSLVLAPDDAARHLTALLELAGSAS
ncbi:MAG: DUF4340 domain-containing protein [Alphaproteobacteria bacterium]|nr:DUF4340 domain-containing protein [Alphaproteobacteria bacterium]